MIHCHHDQLLTERVSAPPLTHQIPAVFPVRTQTGLLRQDTKQTISSLTHKQTGLSPFDAHGQRRLTEDLHLLLDRLNGEAQKASSRTHLPERPRLLSIPQAFRQ